MNPPKLPYEARLFLLIFSGLSVLLFAFVGAWVWTIVYVGFFAFWLVNLHGRPEFRKTDPDAV